MSSNISNEKQVEFIPAEKFSGDGPIEQKAHQYVVPDWEAQMSALAVPNSQLRVPRDGGVSRKKVVEAFTDAFELIGGVPRLAHWASNNPTDFYKLYARLLPSQASSALGESNNMVVRHVLPPSDLDN
jgi:hypothetical protein